MMFAMVCMLLSAVSLAQTSGQPREIIPQARPIAAWLKAVMDGDQDQMKSAFSENMRRQFDREGWDQAMKTYQTAFRKEFGEYKPEDFSFQFKGDESRGTVFIVYRGRPWPGLRVIKENNEWKVDER